MLLRGAVGLTAAVRGVLCLADRGSLTAPAWIAGAVFLAIGILLMIGLLTPIVSCLMGVGSLALLLSWLPLASWSPLNYPVGNVDSLIMAIAIIFLGPGAFSLDAYLFGRREIVIPPASPSSES